MPTLWPQLLCVQYLTLFITTSATLSALDWQDEQRLELKRRLNINIMHRFKSRLT